MADRHPLKRQGDAAFKQKQYTAAIEAYTRLLGEDPTQAVCWLNIGAAYLEKREWEKARESCEKFLKHASEEGEASGIPAAQRAKAHYRMALACLELGSKDATAFGPAIYFRSSARDAERAWALAEGSPLLRQPIADLLRRMRDQLQRWQQAAAHHTPGTAVVAPVVAVRPIEGATVPDQVDELGQWGLTWVRALMRKLSAGEATADSVRAADVVDLLERACLPHSAASLLSALSQGSEECPLFQRQLQVLLSLRAASWPPEAYRTLSRADWLLPAHCIGRFTAPLRAVGEEADLPQCPLAALLVQGLSSPPIGIAAEVDATALTEWLRSQAPGVASIYDNVLVDTVEGPASLQIDLPRFEVIAGCASTLWLLDLRRMAAVAEPLPVSALQEPGRLRR